MAGERVVDFYYSIGSRYSYLASTQIAKLEGETGCQVRWHPVNGLDIRKLRGRDPFAGEPLSGQYEWPYRRYDAECWADYYGVPFREPLSPHFDYPSGGGSRSCLVSGPLRLPHGRADPEHRRRGVHPV